MRKLALGLIAVCLVLAHPAGVALAGRVHGPLFVAAEAEPEGPPGAAGEPRAGRARLVRPRLEGLRAARAVELNPFDDVTLVALQREIVSHAPGRFTWFGRVQGDPTGHVALAVRDGRLVGRIRSESGDFLIRPADAGLHLVRKLDAASLLEDGEPLSAESLQDLQDNAAPDDDDGRRIDVLIAFTPAAAAAAGDVAAFVQMIVDETNLTYAQSGILQQVNPVFYGEVAYTETGSSVQDVLRLQNPADGFMDEVHVWRNRYCADVVSLVAQNVDTCGLAFQMTAPGLSFASNAFSIVNTGCAATNLSYGHEMGHNMGCNHDRLSTANPGAYSYSHGYVNVPGGWRTVMAIFGGTTRLPFWSNPDILYDGEPMGVPGSELAGADCRRTLNNTADIVSGFRQSNACVLSLPENGLVVDRTGPQLTLSWSEACGVVADYTLYEGDLDALRSSGTYGHESVVCSDASADRVENLLPASGNTYYLVVPRDGDGMEGSYGDGRPQGLDTAGCGVTAHRPGGVCL